MLLEYKDELINTDYIKKIYVAMSLSPRLYAIYVEYFTGDKTCINNCGNTKEEADIERNTLINYLKENGALTEIIL